MKAVVAAFNQEKALVGAFSVITNLRMELFQALVARGQGHGPRPLSLQFAVSGAGDNASIDLWERSFQRKQRGELRVVSIHCIMHIIDFAGTWTQHRIQGGQRPGPMMLERMAEAGGSCTQQYRKW